MAYYVPYVTDNIKYVCSDPEVCFPNFFFSPPLIYSIDALRLNSIPLPLQTNHATYLISARECVQDFQA